MLSSLQQCQNEITRLFLSFSASNTDSVVPESEKLYMEGRIVQKLECRPYADPTYYKLKSESIRKASMPQRQVQQLERIVQTFKPVSDHKHNVSDYLTFIINIAVIILKFDTFR